MLNFNTWHRIDLSKEVQFLFLRRSDATYEEIVSTSRLQERERGNDLHTPPAELFGELVQMRSLVLGFVSYAPLTLPNNHDKNGVNCDKRPRYWLSPRCAVPLENSERFQDEHVRVEDLGKPPVDDSPHFKEYWRRIREMEVAFRGPEDPDLDPNDDPQRLPDNFLGIPDQLAVPDNPANLLDTTWSLLPEEEVARLESDDPFYISEGDDYDAELACAGDIRKARRKPLNLIRNAWRLVHLGTSSAVPTRKRNVSSVAFLAAKRTGTVAGIGTDANDSTSEASPHMYLVDCGENTTGRLEQCYWCKTHGFRWLRGIFVTHLHGDHIYGIPPMLQALGQLWPKNQERPTIRIFGPPGIRGYIRANLFMEKDIGITFSVSEMMPRENDFDHIQGRGWTPSNADLLECEKVRSYDSRMDGVPPPHANEVRADDIEASEDGYWHVLRDDDCALEVIAGPLKHRLPCFGYVFNELAHSFVEDSNGTILNGTANNQGHNSCSFPVDVDKARALGVRGRQYAVLRSGRAVKVRGMDGVVTPADVTPNIRKDKKQSQNSPLEAGLRKAVVLGDTCDSSGIVGAAKDCDLLIHEATFLEELKDKAAAAMHSTAKMAGAFASQIRARKLVLTHFSSRYEASRCFTDKKTGRGSFDSNIDDLQEGEDEDEDEDLVSPTVIISEARQTYKKGPIITAYDFMEHDLPLNMKRGLKLQKPNAKNEALNGRFVTPPVKSASGSVVAF